jgi:hypothetical protein
MPMQASKSLELLNFSGCSDPGTPPQKALFSSHLTVHDRDWRFDAALVGCEAESKGVIARVLQLLGKPSPD